MVLQKKIQILDGQNSPLAAVYAETKFHSAVSGWDGWVTVFAENETDTVKVCRLGFDDVKIPFSELETPLVIDSRFSCGVPDKKEESIYGEDTGIIPPGWIDNLPTPDNEVTTKEESKKQSIVSRHWGKIALGGLGLLVLTRNPEKDAQ